MNNKNKIAIKGGSYSFAYTAIVIAILVAINILVSILPTTLTKFDITSTNLYSITSNTKVVVNALEKDVTIYWIVQKDEENDVIKNLLDKYESLSSHIEVIKKNPDVYPTFTANYTSEDVPNNSLIVECGDKYRYISYNDIYLTDVNYTTYSYVYEFDGEGAITSAIDYVVSDELPKIYTLEGHGESDLPDEFQTQIEKENMELESLSLLNTDEIPEDCDVLLIYAPTSDISSEETTILNNYLMNGGKLFVISGPNENGELSNLNGILEIYDVSVNEGIVIESDRNYYAFQQPYILLPQLESSDITDPLIEENYYAIIPLASGLTINGDDATALLTSSSTSYSKVDGFKLETYDKEDGDIDGSFALAVSVETNGGGKLIWIASNYYLEEVYNAYSSGANLDLTMNALSNMIGEREAISIRSKSLGYNYLTISDSDSSKLKTVMIGVVPAVFVLYGIVTVIDRRKKRHV